MSECIYMVRGEVAHELFRNVDVPPTLSSVAYELFRSVDGPSS